MNKLKKLALLPGLLLLILIMGGCSEKIIGTGDLNGGVPVAFKLQSPGGTAAYGLTTVTVAADDMEAPLVDTLAEVDGFIVGEVLVPAGRERKFVVDLYSLGDNTVGVLIYRGVATADVIPKVATVLEVKLLPVVPMIKMDPHFISIVFQVMPVSVPFFIDLEIYKLDTVRSLTLNIYYSDYYTFVVDSVSRGRTLPASALLTYQDDHMGVLSITVQNSTGLIVDRNGFSNLARIYWHGNWNSPSSFVGFLSPGAPFINGATSPNYEVVTDPCEVTFVYDSTGTR